MAKKELTLFQSACGKLRISRLGALTMLTVDGQGLALCLTADFSPVEKWAKAKTQGPNATIDMGKIMEKIDVLISRPGTTFANTRGSIKPLGDIVKAMKASGMDVKEYQLPPELKELDKPVDQVLAAKAAGEAKRAEEGAVAATATSGTHAPLSDKKTYP